MKNLLAFSILVSFSLTAGLFRLHGETRHWAEASKLALPLDPQNGCSYNGVSFLAAGAALLFSKDAGTTWVPVNFPARPVLGVFCGQDILLAGSYFDTWASRDGGATWTPTTGLPPLTGMLFMHVIFTECQGSVFAGIGAIPKDTVGSSGFLYYLKGNNWEPYSTLQRKEIWQINCHRTVMFVGHTGGVHLLELDQGPTQDPISMKDGLRRPCEDSRFGCEIGDISPLVSTPLGAYLLTGYGIFIFRDNQTGWDLIQDALPSNFGTATSALRCGQNYYLPGRSLFKFQTISRNSVKVTTVAELDDSNISNWTDGKSLFAITRTGRILRLKCE